MAGTLTGKYALGQTLADSREAELRDRGELTDDGIAATERLKPWARERGRSTGDLAIAWLLSQAECATVIVGARTTEQLDQNIRAVDWRLGEAEREQVRRLALGSGPA
ncbi:MAG: aldo/keto reductase [Chloroflexi bacterium]|nr:aldo/keto reductase [Chloroflexota bacterium]